CNPNFEGAGISFFGEVQNGLVTPGREVGSDAPLWHIQQTGQTIAGYIFKDIDNNRARTCNPDNTLAMGATATSGNDP
ncbi:hypothetical protein L218DRAFT_841952, partial [Marasmius fiardii PR-910]